MLLFGNQPQRSFPAAQVHFGRFGEAGILADFTIGGDLFSQLDGVMERFRACLEMPPEDGTVSEVPSGEQPSREVREYPPEALREALVNALVHRDYTVSGEIQVRVYGDRIEIWSPGGLPDGVTLEDLRREGHVSRPRNPLLAQAFYAGPVERWGTGTLRMIRACRECDLPEPQFSSESGGFKVSFRKDPYAPEKLQSLGLNERQFQAMLHLKGDRKHAQQTFSGIDRCIEAYREPRYGRPPEEGTPPAPGAHRARYEIHSGRFAQRPAGVEGRQVNGCIEFSRSLSGYSMPGPRSAAHELLATFPVAENLGIGKYSLNRLILFREGLVRSALFCWTH